MLPVLCFAQSDALASRRSFQTMYAASEGGKYGALRQRPALQDFEPLGSILATLNAYALRLGFRRCLRRTRSVIAARKHLNRSAKIVKKWQCYFYVTRTRMRCAGKSIQALFLMETKSFATRS